MFEIKITGQGVSIKNNTQSQARVEDNEGNTFDLDPLETKRRGQNFIKKLNAQQIKIKFI